MLLEEIVEIIEFTDTDHFSKSIDLFNEQGIIHDKELPFLNVVFDKAPQQLATKLSRTGFKGNVQIAKSEKTLNYVVFDSARVSLTEAVQWDDAV